MITEEICRAEGCLQRVEIVSKGLCRKHYQREWAKAHRDERRESCRKYYWGHHEKELERSRRKNGANKEKMVGYNREYYETHHEEILAQHRIWYGVHKDERQRISRENYWANRARRLEYSHRWRQNNKDYSHKWREANVEKARQIVREYFKRHPEVNASKARKYMARKSQVVFDLTPESTAEILALGCFFKPLGDCDGPLAIAHNVPLSKGGNTTAGNTFCLCRRHNSMMRTKTLDKMFTQLPLWRAG